MKAFLSFLLFAMSFLGPTGSNAELIDRGGGLIYDTVRNITWLQDANYAKTSGYHETGRLDWDEAMAFAANLKYHDPVRKVTWDDWRLPSARNQDGSGPDRGYYTRSSELGHMYYNNLGNKGLYAEDKESAGKRDEIRQKRVGVLSDDNPAAPPGAAGMRNRARKTPQEGYGLKSTGPFINLMPAEYWSGTEDVTFSPKTDPRYPSNAWDFFMDTGTQFTCDKWDHWYFAWPVRDGDVGPPPEEKEGRQ